MSFSIKEAWPNATLKARATWLKRAGMNKSWSTDDFDKLPIRVQSRLEEFILNA